VRIISGTYRGKNIIAPATLPVRPTTDYGKTALFNMVHSHFDHSQWSVLDLFAGTGNITYEFISRGVKSITAVDIEPACTRFISETLKKLNAANGNIIKADVFNFLSQCKTQYDFIFADPPYAMPEASKLPELIFTNNLLKPGAWFVLEHERSIDYSQHLHFKEYRHYGKVGFSIFEL
jgi:16S rRNA (guanine966-N2)-methyltransferase